VTRLAIFDLDNTLLDRAAAVRRWAELFADRHGLGPDEVEWIVEADGDGLSPRLEYAATIAARYSLDEPAEELVRARRTEIVELITPYPGATRSLDELRRAGWILAIATNGASVQQRRKITSTGLDAYVDAIVVSEEAGAGKPDRRMFDLVARRCGVRPSATDWMVGDSPVSDVGGGRAVGLRTVWMRRGRAWERGEPAPDAIVDTVPEAAAVILNS
jgi:HAD superfamily hydrolase (TIGR01509 family)